MSNGIIAATNRISTRPLPNRDASSTVEKSSPTAIGSIDRWKGKLYTPLGKAVQCVGRAEQLIRNWLPATGVSFVLAQFSVGKTLLLLDQALCLATDCDWMGYATSRGRFAIYLSGEDQEGTLANAEAWCAQHGLNLNDLTTRIIFAPMTPNLLSTEDCKLLINNVRQQLPEGARPVIFIDTWQRATSEGGQNEDKDMQEAIRNAEFIGKELGGPVVVASHPPKGNAATINGSGVIQNSSVAIWDMRPVSKSSTSRTVTVTRIKGPGQGTVLAVKIVTREIEGKDNYDCQRKGVVLVKDLGSVPREWLAEENTPVIVPLSPHAKSLLLQVAENPNLSFVKHAEKLGWIGATGKPNDSRVRNLMRELSERGFVTKSDGSSYIVTKDGSAMVQKLIEVDWNRLAKATPKSAA